MALPGLFVPEQSLATSIPHPESGESLEIIEHGPDDFVAIHPDGSEPSPVSRADLIVYQVDLFRLVRRIAEAFATEADGKLVEGLPRARQVGLYRPFAGFDFPIYLTVQSEQADFQSVVEGLLARTSTPFVLLAPTTRHYRLGVQHLLSGRNASFLALADAIEASEASWVLSEAARSVLAEFHSRVLPRETTGKSSVFFPTPAGATWGALTIAYVDGESVSVRIRSVTRVLTYTDMGMADRRNGKPTKQWELLRHFLEENGVLTWSSRNADRKKKKQVERLGSALCQVFRIEGNPFQLTSDRKGWQSRFVTLATSR